MSVTLALCGLPVQMPFFTSSDDRVRPGAVVGSRSSRSIPIAYMRNPRMTQSRHGHCFGVALLAWVTPTWAQDAVIHGRVIDDHGDPLPVATVQVLELNVGVFTNGEGRYTLLVPAARIAGQTLTMRVRLIGHKAS